MKYLCTFKFFDFIFFLLILAQFEKSMKYTSMCSESSNFLIVFYNFLGKIIKYKTFFKFIFYFYFLVQSMQYASTFKFFKIIFQFWGEI